MRRTRASMARKSSGATAVRLWVFRTCSRRRRPVWPACRRAWRSTNRPASTNSAARRSARPSASAASAGAPEARRPLIIVSSSRRPMASSIRRVIRLRWVLSRISPAPTPAAAASKAALEAAASFDSSLSTRDESVDGTFTARGDWMRRLSRAKKVSKQTSKRSASPAVLARVTQSASLNRARSANPTLAAARWASMASAGETSTSTARRARRKSASGARASLAVSPAGKEFLDPGLDGQDVPLEFQEHVQGFANEGGIKSVGVQESERAGPIDGFRNRGELAQIQAAHGLDETHQLRAQARLDVRRAGRDDPFLELLVGKGNVQVQAAAFQRIAEVPYIVGGEEHHRRDGGPDHPDFRNRHLVGRQQLQQESLERLVALVDLVDQQHRATLGAQRLEQRPGLHERFGKEQVPHVVEAIHGRLQARRAGQFGAHVVLEDLGIEELLAVLPFIQRLGLVQPLVALHADQRQPQQAGGRERQFGLADAGHALDQDRLLQVGGHVERGGDAPRGDVADAGQALDNRVHGIQRVGDRGHWLA